MTCQLVSFNFTSIYGVIQSIQVLGWMNGAIGKNT